VKARLAAAGLFAEARKRAIPAHPRRIGIVTSRHAAALRDVLTTLRRRFPALPVILYPAAVQGASAPRELAAAIRAANAHAHVDVLILCRGGGSLEDLWAFNEEIVARAVYESRLPIVSGIGHDTDFTICDFVADARAATPTGAAQLVAPDCAALRAGVAALWRRFTRAAAHQSSNRAQRIDAAARRLVHPATRLARQMDLMQGLRVRLSRAFRQRHAIDVRRVGVVQARLLRELRAPPAAVQQLPRIAQRLERAGRDRLDRAERNVRRLADALALLNPEAVLERGYAIVTGSGGTIIADAGQLTVGDDVGLRFASGHATATVKAIETRGES
jgi:exodeoxyribonuclease VII large subunit